MIRKESFVGFLQHVIELGARHQLAVEDIGLDRLGVMDVGERILVQEHEVGDYSTLSGIASTVLQLYRRVKATKNSQANNARQREDNIRRLRGQQLR